jgi:hypothetical protein
MTNLDFSNPVGFVKGLLEGQERWADSVRSSSPRGDSRVVGVGAPHNVSSVWGSRDTDGSTNSNGPSV